jgi:hypothetical protein
MSQYFDNVDLKSNIEKYKTRIFDKEFALIQIMEYFQKVN